MNDDKDIGFQRDANVHTRRGSSRWTSFVQSLRRVTLATLVAVPLTGILAAAMFLVPPAVAAGIGISGIVLFYVGKEFDRPILLAIGGIVMFAGVLSWGFRQ